MNFKASQKIVMQPIMFLIRIVFAFVFSLIAQKFYKKTEIDTQSILKGAIERIFLVIFLFNNLPQVLTFFSALKLATLLKHDEAKSDVQKFNNYYLTGNMVSASVALWYYHFRSHAGDIDQIIEKRFAV